MLHYTQVPVNMSVDLTRHPEQSSRNLENRRREREVILLRKAHELHVDHNAEVYIVVQHRETDRVLIYNSEPAEHWPIPYEKTAKHLGSPANLPTDMRRKAGIQGRRSTRPGGQACC